MSDNGIYAKANLPADGEGIPTGTFWFLTIVIGVPILIFKGIGNVAMWAYHNPLLAIMVAGGAYLAFRGLLWLRQRTIRQPKHWSER